MSTSDTPDVRGYTRSQILLSAAVSVVATALLVWWASGFGPFYETIFRVGPTIEEGIGADWAAGNTIPALDFLIALVHAADVIMGVFLLFLAFVHWIAFRRLADRMSEPPGTEQPTAEETATDGGTLDETATDGGVTEQGGNPP